MTGIWRAFDDARRLHAFMQSALDMTVSIDRTFCAMAEPICCRVSGAGRTGNSLVIVYSNSSLS